MSDGELGIYLMRILKSNTFSHIKRRRWDDFIACHSWRGIISLPAAVGLKVKSYPASFLAERL